MGGLLKARKGVHPIGLDVAFEPLTPKDHEDARWGVEHGVDLFAQSFVRRAEDVRALERVLAGFGGNQPIIAKIDINRRWRTGSCMVGFRNKAAGDQTKSGSGMPRLSEGTPF